MKMMDAIHDTSSSEKGKDEGELLLMSRVLYGEIQPMAVPNEKKGMHTEKKTS